MTEYSHALYRYVNDVPFGWHFQAGRRVMELSREENETIINPGPPVSSQFFPTQWRNDGNMSGGGTVRRSFFCGTVTDPGELLDAVAFSGSFPGTSDYPVEDIRFVELRVAFFTPPETLNFTYDEDTFDVLTVEPSPELLRFFALASPNDWLLHPSYAWMTEATDNGDFTQWTVAIPNTAPATAIYTGLTEMERPPVGVATPSFATSGTFDGDGYWGTAMTYDAGTGEWTDGDEDTWQILGNGIFIHGFWDVDAGYEFKKGAAMVGIGTFGINLSPFSVLAILEPGTMPVVVWGNMRHVFWRIVNISESEQLECKVLWKELPSTRFISNGNGSDPGPDVDDLVGRYLGPAMKYSDMDPEVGTWNTLISRTLDPEEEYEGVETLISEPAVGQVVVLNIQTDLYQSWPFYLDRSWLESLYLLPGPLHLPFPVRATTDIDASGICPGEAY